jgi:hypothetical protein
VEPVQLLLDERQADQPAAVLRHEVDRFRGRPLRGHAQIALVLAIHVVHQDHHLAGADVLDGSLDRGRGPGDVFRALREPEMGRGVRHRRFDLPYGPRSGSGGHAAMEPVRMEATYQRWIWVSNTRVPVGKSGPPEAATW